MYPPQGYSYIFHDALRIIKRERKWGREREKEENTAWTFCQLEFNLHFVWRILFFLFHLNHQSFERVFFLQLTPFCAPFCQCFIWLFHHFVFVFNTLTLCLATPSATASACASTQRVVSAKHARRAIIQFEQMKFETLLLLLLLMFFLAICINYSYYCRVYVCKSWDN